MRIQSVIFGRLSIARKMLVIVGVFVAIVICVFLLGALRSEILTGVRAYVGGESLWSKSEKKAVLSLTRYASTHDESDYDQYLTEIAVPEGDRIARQQLLFPSPDMKLVRQGFVQGRNHPDDVESMAMLVRRFGHFGYMATAIAIWTEGDRYIDQLRDRAEALHAEIKSNHPDAARIQRIVAEVTDIDARITPLEDAFSSTLGEGARWVNRTLSIVAFAATCLLLLLGIGLSSAIVKRIRTSDEKYRNLINTANDGILLVDSEKRVVLEANEKACELLGISEEQLIGMPESKLYYHDGQTRPILNPASDDIPRRRELELLRSDGTTVPVEVSVSTTKVGGRPALLGIFRDIRERMEAAAILQRREARFGHLIQNLSDVITVVAVDTTMLYLSPSVERMAGYRPSELLGRSFLELVHPQDQAPVRAVFERLILQTGTATPPEFRFRHKDGAWIWLESIVNNLLNDAAVGGVVVISRDVSGRRVLEEQVRQSQKMEAVGRLAGGIAHDFNNLLMVIRGYAEIVLLEAGITAGARKSVETIVRTADSAASLTRQLLSFSRKHVFSPQVLELNSVVSRMSEMLLGVLREEMEFKVKLNPEEIYVSADRGQIEQVIMNLVVNARDAMPKGGKLALETARVRIDQTRASRFSAVPPGDYVMLAVSDTGIGMDAETQSRIFEPFFTTKSRDEGTGLGLSVVYNIVRGSGGHVRVDSELGRGTTLRAFFPRVSTPPTEEAEPSRTTIPSTGMETILVAEDQPELRWMICQFLQERGYSVLEAKDGRDAVELAEQYNSAIDVVLTDVVMPFLRGPEVARRISASRPQIKVIFMSGYTEGEVIPERQIEWDGRAVLLQKPFELDLLAVKIREVLEAGTRR